MSCNGVQKKVKYSDEHCHEETPHKSLKHKQINELSDAYLDIIKTIGEDPDREGLLKTPQRAAKAILHFTKGYHQTVNGKESFYFKSLPEKLM